MNTATECFVFFRRGIHIVDDVVELHRQLINAGVEIRQKPEISKWNPAESSALFYDSEDNLMLITSTKDR